MEVDHVSSWSSERTVVGGEEDSTQANVKYLEGNFVRRGAAMSPPWLTYPMNAGKLSSDGIASGRQSRGSRSRSPPATIPRSHRFYPTPSPPPSVRETNRRLRIESEQRRRDELMSGYARLKDTLPVSNERSSQVSLLNRGSFIRFLLHTLLLTIVQQLDTLGISRQKKRSWNSN